MSVSAALSNALSGLAASARGAEVVAANIANAQTPGFGRRELALSAQSLGGAGAGVQIDAVSRVVDQTVLADRRNADAASASAGVMSGFYEGLENALGIPGDAGALTTLYSAFEGSLADAASRPDSAARLQAVVDAAKNLVTRFNVVSDTIQSARLAADTQIGNQVRTVNDALSKVADLNLQIRYQQGAGRDATALMDQRQTLVDRVAAIIPLREMPRENGQIALYTPQGAVLLDGRPATLGFAAVGVITADTTLAAGGLSGLTLNGVAVSMQGEVAPLGGGTLGALFALRDAAAPGAQQGLDAVARDLVSRLQDPALVPPNPDPVAGMFTDSGALFDPANEVGLAGRIALNPLLNPAEGGALWRLRAGLSAGAANDVGDSSQIAALSAALSTPLVPQSGNFSAGRRGAAGLAADLVAYAGAARQTANDEQTYTATRADTLRILELQGGVDSDRELQNLLLIEQAFAANAKVIKTVDDMIQTLIGLT